jgi:protein-tyrosine phosphatase
MGFVDLHSHVLPGLDDGSPDAATSHAMLRGLAELGFDTVFATPHQKAGQFLPSRDAIDAAFAALAPAAPGGLRLGLAAENMWDDVFFERLQRGEIPGYGDGPAFLFELRPDGLPPGLTDHLFKLTVDGRLPVLAHPERYHPLHDDRARLARLRTQAAFVVDLGALGGHHGRAEKQRARALLEDGLAHAVASDAHGPEDVARAAEGIAWIRKRLGPAAVTRLLDDGPRAILAGELPD